MARVFIRFGLLLPGLAAVGCGANLPQLQPDCANGLDCQDPVSENAPVVMDRRGATAADPVQVNPIRPLFSEDADPSGTSPSSPAPSLVPTPDDPAPTSDAPEGVSVTVPLPTRDGRDPGTPSYSDPGLFNFFGETDPAEFLPSVVDGLTLDLLIPAQPDFFGSGRSVYDFTYLERLCLQRGTPEFVCRQRYGP